MHSTSIGPLQDVAPVHSSCCSRLLPLHFPFQRQQLAGHAQVKSSTLKLPGVLTAQTRVEIGGPLVVK